METIKKILLKLAAAFSSVIVIFVIAIFILVMYFNAPSTYHNQDKRFVITRGQTFREVVDQLYAQKIIRHPTVFLYTAQLVKGYDPKVLYGEYFFEKNISYYKIMHKIHNGYIYFRKVTIAEGLSTDSALKIVDAAPALIGDLPADVAEGSLLPETYFYSYNDTKSGMVRRMQMSMQKTIDELWEARDLSIPIKTKNEAIILASIVEKESGIAEERPKIAAVFVNRLNKGMRLQSDPTVIYSFSKGNRVLERKIRSSDLANKSRYNTYFIHGLPPTAICNPGIASIKAVLNPPRLNYLYFVATGNGDHIFASTLEEHNRNVASYYQNLRVRERVQASSASLNQDQNPAVKQEQNSTNQNSSQNTKEQNQVGQPDRGSQAIHKTQ